MAWAKSGKEESSEINMPPMITSKHEHLRLLAKEYATGSTRRESRLEPGKPIEFSCPVSGFPTHCSKEGYDADTEYKKYATALRTIHEDLLDLCSGRAFPELAFPGEPRIETEITNWVKYFFDRGFRCENDARAQRHLSQMFTWPLTIAYALQQASTSTTIANLEKCQVGVIPQQREVPCGNSGEQITMPALTVCIVGARQEAAIPARVWQELSLICPSVHFDLHFVGPEISAKSVRPREYLSNAQLSLSYERCRLEEMELQVPDVDLFVLFHGGIGFQNETGNDEWAPALEVLFASGKPLLFTAFSAEDAARDEAYIKQAHDECEVLLPMEQNPMMNMKQEAARNDITHLIQSNHSCMLVRGINRPNHDTE